MRRHDWALLALLIPFALLLYPPLYAGLKPELDGIPLFIWYQFLLVLVGASITAAVYWVREQR